MQPEIPLWLLSFSVLAAGCANQSPKSCQLPANLKHEYENADHVYTAVFDQELKGVDIDVDCADRNPQCTGHILNGTLLFRTKQIFKGHIEAAEAVSFEPKDWHNFKAIYDLNKRVF